MGAPSLHSLGDHTSFMEMSANPKKRFLWSIPSSDHGPRRKLHDARED
jgi:hypothetical protein